MLPSIIMTLKGVFLLVGGVLGFAALLRKGDAAWVKGAPLWILPGMYVLGMWGHYYALICAVLVLALPLLAKGRADAAALYCLLTVSVPLLMQQIVVGSLYVISADKYLFCAIGLTIAYLMNRGHAQVLRQAHFGLPVLLILVLELAQARDPSFTATLRQALPAFLTILLPYFLLSRSLNNAEDVRRFLLAFVLAGFAMAIIATVEARLHWLIYQQIEGRLGVHVGINGYAKQRAGMLRAPASFPESTELGTFLALSFMAALALRDSFASRNKWYLVLLVLLSGLVAANSRGAFIALAVGLCAWDVYCRRYSSLALKALAAGGLYFFALFAAQFSAFFAAMVGRGSGTGSTTEYRKLLFRRGMEEIHKHPLLGQSMKTALSHLEDLRQGEGIIDIVNGYINYGLTLGYPGMIGLLLAFVSLAMAMWVARKKLHGNRALLEPAACVFAVATLTILNSFFTGFGNTISTSFYQICALGSALWAMRKLAPVPQSGSVAGPPRPLSGVAALIAADRARATARAAAEA